jgi:hypothetical protein
MSVILGVGWGLLQGFTIYLVQPLQLPFGVSTLQRAVIWVQMALDYLVTPLAFYLLGRRELPGFRTGLALAAVYVGSLIGVGGIQASSAVLHIGDYYLPPLPFSILPAAGLSLDFLFPAFSGLALARLSNKGLHLGRTDLAIPFVAMAFALSSNFINGYEGLSGPNLNFASFGIINLGLFLVALPIQFVVFYALGQIISLRGKAFRAFGLLFLGAYVGGVVGTALAVGLFGQAQWVPPPGGGFSWREGIVYNNMSNSLVTLMEGLNPISALPFLSFFGLTLSQVGKTTDEPMAAGSQDASSNDPSA